MPRLTTYGLEVELVKKVSQPLATELAQLFGIPRELIALQVNQDLFIQDGQEQKGSPFLELCLFDRGQEKEDQAVQLITKHFKEQGCPELDVYLTKLERRRYYENGQHF